MKTLYKALFIVLILFVPLVSILGASNIVLRMPDAYAYQFNDLEFTKQNGLDYTNQELAEYISKFMSGKHEDFKLRVDYEGQKSELFTEDENKIMKHFRGTLDKLMFFFSGITLVSIASYYVLFHGKRKEAISVAIKGAAIFYLVLIVIGLICFFIPVVREAFYSLFFGYKLSKNGMLTLILTKQLANKCIIGIIAISGIIMIGISYLTRKLTQPRRMFKQHY